MMMVVNNDEYASTIDDDTSCASKSKKILRKIFLTEFYCDPNTKIVVPFFYPGIAILGGYIAYTLIYYIFLGKG